MLTDMKYMRIRRMNNNDNEDTIIAIVISILIASFIWFMIKDGTIVVSCTVPIH